MQLVVNGTFADCHL